MVLPRYDPTSPIPEVMRTRRAGQQSPWIRQDPGESARTPSASHTDLDDVSAQDGDRGVVGKGGRRWGAEPPWMLRSNWTSYAPVAGREPLMIRDEPADRVVSCHRGRVNPTVTLRRVGRRVGGPLRVRPCTSWPPRL